METLTRNKYQGYVEKLSNSLKLDSNGELRHITLNPELETQFFERIKRNSFLGLINVFRSEWQEGTCLGLNMPTPSTTDTKYHPRGCEKGFIAPIQEFNCGQINLDHYVNYTKLDSFTQLEGIDFNQTLQHHIDQQILTALLMSGWNGKNRADTSSIQANPLAEDTAKGWLQKIRENVPEQVESQAKSYASKRALIKEALAKMAEPYRSKGDLVAIVGREILGDEDLTISSQDLTAPNRIIIAQKTLGGLKAIYCPYFPDNAVLITSLDNISLYVQKGTIRKSFVENPSRDRIETYRSMVVDFIIEDYRAVALIENATISEKTA